MMLSIDFMLHQLVPSMSVMCEKSNLRFLFLKNLRNEATNNWNRYALPPKVYLKRAHRVIHNVPWQCFNSKFPLNQTNLNIFVGFPYFLCLKSIFCIATTLLLQFSQLNTRRHNSPIQQESQENCPALRKLHKNVNAIGKCGIILNTLPTIDTDKNWLFNKTTMLPAAHKRLLVTGCIWRCNGCMKMVLQMQSAASIFHFVSLFSILFILLLWTLNCSNRFRRPLKLWTAESRISWSSNLVPRHHTYLFSTILPLQLDRERQLLHQERPKYSEDS